MAEEWGTLANLGLPKFHKLHHLVHSIRMLGHPKHYNGDIFEENHLVMKKLYGYVVLQ